jgi:SAM-dependent methyltransferase
MPITRAFYPEVEFGGFTDVDGTIRFYTRLHGLIASERATVVDFGCGAGDHVRDEIVLRRKLRDLRSKQRTVIGIDIDPEARTNPFVDEFRLLVPGKRWPVESHSAQLVVADCVVEHLLAPDEFFGEAARVLSPGGHLCLRTPNLLHYVPLISRLVPERYHRGILSKAQPARSACDLFPLYYRCNTVRRLRTALRSHGFACAVFTHEPEPGYLGFSELAYRLGVMYQKHAPSLLRAVIYAFARRQPREELQPASVETDA